MLTSFFHITTRPPPNPASQLTPKALGKPNRHLKSCYRFALIFVSDKKGTTGLCTSTILRISRTASDLPQPRQFKHKVFIVRGGGCQVQPPLILHLCCLRLSVSFASPNQSQPDQIHWQAEQFGHSPNLRAPQLGRLLEFLVLTLRSPLASSCAVPERQLVFSLRKLFLGWLLSCYRPSLSASAAKWPPHHQPSPFLFLLQLSTGVH